MANDPSLCDLTDVRAAGRLAGPGFAGESVSATRHLAVVHGASTPPGRLFRVTEHVLQHARSHGDLAGVELIDMSAMPFGTEGDASGAVAVVRSAAAVMVVSPVYRASIPSALKWLLDELPVDALTFKPVGIVAMGGSAHGAGRAAVT